MVKKYIFAFFGSLFIVIVFNIPVAYMFQYYLVIPNSLFGWSFLFEWILLFELFKKKHNIYRFYDKYIVTCTYFIALVSILLVRYEYGYSVLQLNPLACFREVYYGSYKEWANFLFNIVAFIPLPICMQVYTKNKMMSACISLLVGICIELVQLFTQRGIFDTGDILLYCIGILIGYIILKIMSHA